MPEAAHEALERPVAILLNAVKACHIPAAARYQSKVRLTRSPGLQCDAINGSIPVTTWSQRVSFVIYVIAITATIGAACFHVEVPMHGWCAVWACL